MGKVAHSHLPLLVEVGEEGAAVVDAEVEDAVLVGCPEGYAENGRVCGLRDGRQIKAVEGREHAELELHRVAGGGGEGGEVVVFVFGDFDLEGLGLLGTATVRYEAGVLTTSCLIR
jgi:hypothetical protein